MKHFFLSFGLAALSGMVFANPVTVQTAQTVATNFISSKVGNATLTLTKSVPSNTATGQTSFYIFDVNNGKGFVIVSGEDAVKPILGYSATNIFPAEITNKEVAYWLDGYNEQISAVISNHFTASANVAADWANYATASGGHTASKVTDVQPMITTLWDQMKQNSSTGNTLYNNLCPTNTPTGCVATAMAQIMNYWQKPTIGTGTHSYSTSTVGGTLTADFGAATYDWPNMPSQLHTSSTTAQKNAVATLMYDCGVGVDMDYNYASADGSGSQVISYYGQYGANFPSAEHALPTYFGYKSTIKGVARQFYSDTQWVNMLKFELDNGRPVLHAGFGALGGHAFDFDGYDNNDMFDINWGWSGASNGYFTVDNLAPPSLGVGAGNGNFNDGQQALIQIEPASNISAPNPNYPDFPTYTLALGTSITQSSDTIVYNTAYNVTAQIKNTGDSALIGGTLYLVAMDNSNSNAFILSQKTATIQSGASNTFTFNTTGSTTLAPGVYTLKYKYMVEAIVDTNKLLVGNGVSTNSKTLVVKSAAAPTAISNIALNGAELSVYPNPSHDFVTIDWTGYNGNVKTIELYNVLGQKVQSIVNIKGNNIKIPVSQLSAGTYMVHIVTEQGMISKEISVK